jgi:hypothetical protein
VKAVLVYLLLRLAFADGHYDARERAGLRKTSSYLGLEWSLAALGGGSLAAGGPGMAGGAAAVASAFGVAGAGAGALVVGSASGSDTPEPRVAVRRLSDPSSHVVVLLSGGRAGKRVVVAADGDRVRERGDRRRPRARPRLRRRRRAGGARSRPPPPRRRRRTALGRYSSWSQRKA